MRPIVTDRVVWSVSLSVTVVSPAKTAEPIDMPFGLEDSVRPRNHVLDEVQIAPYECAVFMARDMPGHARRHTAMSSAKMAEPIEMPLGVRTLVGPGNHVLDGGPDRP